MSSKTQLGKAGEQFVADYLTKQGYLILAQNYRKQYGEVDIIACKDDVLAFVEVKFRNNPLIDPAEIISHSKQRSIIKIAKYFLSTHTNTDVTCRFDVALVEKNNTIQTLRYISNAFTTFD